MRKKALPKLNDKLLEIFNDRGTIANCLFSPLSKISNPENTSQFELVKDPNSISVNDKLVYKTKLVTLYNKLITFHDTEKKFKLQGNHLKMMTNGNHNVDLLICREKNL